LKLGLQVRSPPTAALNDYRGTINLVAEMIDRFRNKHNLLTRLSPIALFNGFTDRRKRLDAVTGVEARGVDLVLKPGTLWESATSRECPLAAVQNLVQRFFDRGWQLATGRSPLFYLL
jgi:hypothetical protein